MEPPIRVPTFPVLCECNRPSCQSWPRECVSSSRIRFLLHLPLLYSTSGRQVLSIDQLEQDSPTDIDAAPQQWSTI